MEICTEAKVQKQKWNVWKVQMLHGTKYPATPALRCVTIPQIFCFAIEVGNKLHSWLVDKQHI